jgi:hypothetical protein
VTLCDTVLDVPWHGQNNFRTISSAILDLFSVPGEIQHKFQILVPVGKYSILKLLLPKQNSAHFPQALEIYLWMIWAGIRKPR